MAFPTATVTQGSGLTVNTLPNAGQATMANSLGVAIASDQSAVPASQFGVWTVQIGNTPNTTAIKVDGSAAPQPVTGTFWQATQPVSGTFWQATQPVSGTFWQATQPVSVASLPLPAGAATNAGSATLSTGQVSVTTANTQIVAARAGRLAVTIRNVTGTGQIAVGLTGVSTANGFILLAVAGDTITIPTSQQVCGTVAATSQTVCFIETF